MPCDTSSKEQTGDIITFTQFKEGNSLSETLNDAKNSNKSNEESDVNSIILPLLSKEEIDAMDSGDESDDESVSTQMLEDIHDSGQSHPGVNSRDARYKIRDCIKQRQLEWKESIKATQNMGKGSHKVYTTAVKEISRDLSSLGESGSEVSHFIPEPINVAEV